MMVDEHTLGVGVLHGWGKVVKPPVTVEVQAKYQVGITNICLSFLHALVVTYHSVTAGQPLQIVGIHVRNNEFHVVLAKRAQICRPAENGAHGIAIGTDVTTKYNALSLVNERAELGALLLV